MRDENNRLKGEQGKPDIKPSKKGNTCKHSSEKERQTPKKHSKSSKKASIKIDRKEIKVMVNKRIPIFDQVYPT
ncbi:hypothetical protein [Anabaena sp. UHCC 0451]|uniref:hypothetical protein n=1 Tax=Anabaena sp. UHCC 0451 TaxID=2055235 RepID=UPI002B218F9A|nr:hypothetical protein [Anabaena sp. UHCC 0451]MEA5578477.1 hypothetical protein [Anabaena sp. UHCC 0451]